MLREDFVEQLGPTGVKSGVPTLHKKQGSFWLRHTLGVNPTFATLRVTRGFKNTAFTHSIQIGG
jgi:hypothetical protein